VPLVELLLGSVPLLVLVARPVVLLLRGLLRLGRDEQVAPRLEEPVLELADLRSRRVELVLRRGELRRERILLRQRRLGVGRLERSQSSMTIQTAETKSRMLDAANQRFSFGTW
jgi:hypothetical protein